MKLLPIIVLFLLFSCKKEETLEKINVFYEVAGDGFYNIELNNSNGSKMYFDSVSTGFNYQEKFDKGSDAFIKATKLGETKTPSYLRLYVGFNKYESFDTVNSTFAIIKKVE